MVHTILIYRALVKSAGGIKSVFNLGISLFIEKARNIQIDFQLYIEMKNMALV